MSKLTRSEVTKALTEKFGPVSIWVEVIHGHPIVMTEYGPVSGVTRFETNEGIADWEMPTGKMEIQLKRGHIDLPEELKQ